MNAFADSLFSIMLGWARSLFQKVLGIFSGGGEQSFLTWLGDHWLGLAIVLVLIGLAVDLVVWLCRYRPYLAWRTAFRKITGRSINDRSFDKGYSGALSDVAQPDRQYTPQPAPFPYESNADYAAPDNYAQEQNPYAAQPVYQQPAPQPQAPAYPPYQSQPVYQPQEYYGQQAPAQPVYPYQRQTYDNRQPAPQRQQSTLGKKVSSLRDRLRPDADNAEIQGLPPIVQKEDAFYEPVYPDERKGYRG